MTTGTLSGEYILIHLNSLTVNNMAHLKTELKLKWYKHYLLNVLVVKSSS